jgi:hypothetical protein
MLAVHVTCNIMNESQIQIEFTTRLQKKQISLIAS